MPAQNNSYEFKAEMKQLLKLIVHSLYTNPEIFLRELISNSSDALNKIRFMRSSGQDYINPELDLNIKITLDKENNLFTIEDTGNGMTKDELISQLGTIASSGTLNFLENLAKENNKIDANLIGQFGVGFYSVFMVTDAVSVETKSAYPNNDAYIWKSNGLDTFTIEKCDKATRGTIISFKLKDEYKSFLEDFNIKNILKKYSNFVDFPIIVNNEVVNTLNAIWHKKKEDLQVEEVNEFYKFISNDFQDPLGYLQVNIEGNINFKALLFIPNSAPENIFRDLYDKTLHLYSSRVFIQDNCKELLPDYLKFVQGVVDTEDLPLNVSREVIQASPLISKISKLLTSKIISWLESWAQNDKEKFNTFYKNFGSLFKTGINSDFANKEKIFELLRFESTSITKGETTSLHGYVTRMKPDQDDIYYVLGEHRELIENNPKLEYYKKNNIEVLLLSDPVDFFTIPYIFEYQKKKLTSIEKAQIKSTENNDIDNKTKETNSKLIDIFQEILKNKIEKVVESNTLIDSAVTLSAGTNAMDPQMERMMKMFDKSYTDSKKILEINLKHPLIQNLAKLIEKNEKDKNVSEYINLLYSTALLIDGNLKTTNEFVEQINSLILQSTTNELSN